MIVDKSLVYWQIIEFERSIVSAYSASISMPRPKYAIIGTWYPDRIPKGDTLRGSKLLINKRLNRIDLNKLIVPTRAKACKGNTRTRLAANQPTLDYSAINEIIIERGIGP